MYHPGRPNLVKSYGSHSHRTFSWGSPHALSAVQICRWGPKSTEQKVMCYEHIYMYLGCSILSRAHSADKFAILFWTIIDYHSGFHTSFTSTSPCLPMTMISHLWSHKIMVHGLNHYRIRWLNKYHHTCFTLLVQSSKGNKYGKCLKTGQTNWSTIAGNMRFKKELSKWLI